MRSWPVVTAVLVVLVAVGAAVVFHASPSSEELSSEPAPRRDERGDRSSRPILPTLPQPVAAYPAHAQRVALDRAIPLPPADPRAALRWFEDTRRPLTQRAAAIDALARAGDADALRRLMTLADSRVYLRFKGVEALGAFRNPAPPAGYLAGKLGHDDPRVARAAIRALERRSGPNAVATIAASISRNVGRPDGFTDQINAEAVRTLGKMGAPAAAPALIAELARVQQEGTNLDYGSLIVAALAKTRTPPARRAINSYAAWLTSGLSDDPLARRYHLDKIDEARRAVAGANSW